MGLFSNIWNIGTDVAHRITGIPTASEKRNAKAQLDAYRQQTELTRSEINRKKGEELSEKRRIEEKQIRSLRRNYRAQSFLGTQETNQPDMSAKLGG